MLKKIFVPLMISLASALLLAGCSGSETANSGSANDNKAVVVSNTPSSTSAAKTETSGEKIGVPECDDFLAKYESCVKGKVPEAQRATFQKTMTDWRSSWKKLADIPQTKSTLPGVCKQAAESTKASLKAFGCDL